MPCVGVWDNPAYAGGSRVKHASGCRMHLCWPTVLRVHFATMNRKKLFSLRAVRPWHRLLRKAVHAPTPAVLRARLDGVLSNLLQWKLFLPWQGVGPR